MNWPDLMALGLGRMRLSPETFWSMTPSEFRAALGVQAADPIPREAFDALTALYPDTPHD